MKKELLAKIVQGFAFGFGLGLALVIVFSVYVLVAGLCMPSDIEEVPVDLLEVHDIAVDQTDDTWMVRFVITNRSKKPVHGFIADVDLFDNKENFTGEVQKCFNGNLLPGKSDGMMVSQLDLQQTAPNDIVACRVRIGNAYSKKE